VDELVTEHARFPLQIRQHPVTVLLFINLLARIHRGRTIAQHALDEPRQLLGGRCHRLGCAQPRAHATIIGPQGTMTID